MKKGDISKIKAVKDFSLALMIFTGIGSILNYGENILFMSAFTVCFISFCIYAGAVMLIYKEDGGVRK